MLKFWFRTNLALLGVYVGIEIISRLYLGVYEWNANRSKRNGITEALFTSDKICNCENNLNCQEEYCYYYTVRLMASFINGAQYSIHICMNIFTSEDLARVVLEAHQRGVKVRIIANRSTAYATGSQMVMLHEHGMCHGI